MSSIRVRFSREGDTKYISHLDLMKFFDRALRRARIPIAYSQGFNPHPQMVFGLPMPVGLTSEAEYADFQLAGEMKPEEFSKALNEQLPEGLKITGAGSLESRDNIMKIVAAASYEVSCTTEKNLTFDSLSDMICTFMKQPTMVVEKETKGKIKEIDIKPLIINIQVASVNPGRGHSEARMTMGTFLSKDDPREQRSVPLPCSSSDVSPYLIYMLLKAGNEANLKPELLITSLNNICDAGLSVKGIHRTGLFVLHKGSFTDPLDASVIAVTEGGKNVG